MTVVSPSLDDLPPGSKVVRLFADEVDGWPGLTPAMAEAWDPDGGVWLAKKRRGWPWGRWQTLEAAAAEEEAEVDGGA